MRQKLKLLVPIFAFALTLYVPKIALAIDCPANQAVPIGGTTCQPIKVKKQCPSLEVSKTDPTQCAPLSATSCPTGQLNKTGTACSTFDADCVDQNNCISDNPIYKNLNTIINFMGGLVSIVVVANVIIGGIQYSMAGGAPDKLSAARKRIANSVMALAGLFLAYGFLQWLIPGGVFG